MTRRRKSQKLEKQWELGGCVIGLKYDIAIHLPATKDIEVYNAIFKSLRDHLVD